MTFIAAQLAVCGCAAYERAPEPTTTDTGTATQVTVPYATNRTREGEEGTNFGYEDGRGVLRFGIAQVSLPPGHVTGRLEAPPLRSPAALADRRFHVYLEVVREVRRDAFLGNLRRASDRAGRSEILVFVHGYNTDFNLAVRRTAQLASDLEFAGAAMAFSWPSAGRATAYIPDQNNADWAASGLAEMLRMIAEETGVGQVHVLAHSMGGRLLLAAFDELTRGGRGVGQPLFGQVIFAAPDVDAEIFAASVPRHLPLATRFTLYVSDSDMALAASRRAAGGYPRAGDSKTGTVVLPGMDTVDVSDVRDDLFGHEYFGESEPVLDDIGRLLQDGAGAAQRPRMSRQETGGGQTYWRLLPPRGR